MKRIVPYSMENVSKQVKVDTKKFGTPAPDAVVQKTKTALEANGFAVKVADSSEAALRILKELVPKGATVMNGSSTTLDEIGFTDYLKSPDLPLSNLHGPMLAEKDKQKHSELRRLSVTADYYFSSAQAITMDGALVGCDASGSRVGAWPFAAKNLVIVAGTNKIVPDLEVAIRRLHEYALQLENVRARAVYGFDSYIANIVVMRKQFAPRATVVLVREALGY